MTLEENYTDDEFMLEIVKWQEELNKLNSIDALIYDTLEHVLDTYISYCTER